MSRHPSRTMPGLKDDGFEESDESDYEETGPTPFCGPKRYRERKDDDDINQGGNPGGLCY